MASVDSFSMAEYFFQKKHPQRRIVHKEQPFILRVVFKKPQKRGLNNLPQLKIDSRGFTLVAC